MEMFSLIYEELIFSIFLPFLFFFLLLYALLRKSKILGEKANRLNLLLALLISALGVFSLYSLGLAVWLPLLAAFLIVSSFLLIFAFNVGVHTLKKVMVWKEEALVDRKKFEEGVKNCEKIWKKFEEEKDVTKKLILLGEMKNEIEKIKPLAEKLGVNISNFDWYRKYEEVIKTEGDERQ